MFDDDTRDLDADLGEPGDLEADPGTPADVTEIDTDWTETDDAE